MTTKKVYVELFAHETIVQKCVLVVEVPADCDDSEIMAFSAVGLDSEAVQQGADPCWEETGKTYGYEIQDDVKIESGVPDDEEAHVVLERDENGKLAGS